MSNQTYQKPALHFSQQIQHLQNKGMIFSDMPSALNQLSSISYYRLSGYWYPFRIRDTQGCVSNQLEPNTHFDTVIALYEFDRKLRALILDAIERIEVAVRTQFTYHIGHKYAAFGHTDSNNFHRNFDHQRWLQKFLLMLRHLLRATGNGEEWADTISDLLSPWAEQKRWRAAMGLPEDWRVHPIWK
jgi:abortive infection bacteriophage resistance protein